MRNRLIVSLAAAGLTLATGIGTAAGASAATPAGSTHAAAPTAVGRTTGRGPNALRPTIIAGCSAGYLCIWKNPNFNDGPGKISDNIPSWYVLPHASCPNGTWADCVSSVDNAATSGMGVVLFSGLDYSGGNFCVPDDTSYPNISDISFGMDTSIVSNIWTWAC